MTADTRKISHSLFVACRSRPITQINLRETSHTTYHEEDHCIGRKGRVARQEREPHFFQLVRIAVGVGADEALVIAVLVLIQGAVDVGPTDIEKVRPQSADGVLGDVGGQLRAGGPKQENADDLVAFPNPQGHRLGADGSCAFVVPELGGYELKIKLIRTGLRIQSSG